MWSIHRVGSNLCSICNMVGIFFLFASLAWSYLCTNTACCQCISSKFRKGRKQSKQAHGKWPSTYLQSSTEKYLDYSYWRLEHKLHRGSDWQSQIAQIQPALVSISIQEEVKWHYLCRKSKHWKSVCLEPDTSIHKLLEGWKYWQQKPLFDSDPFVASGSVMTSLISQISLLFAFCSLVYLVSYQIP